jgi:hypothetical protein
MKILFIKSFVHIKNFNFILKCKNIQFTIVNNINDAYNYNFEDFDCVYSPSDAIDVLKYPNTKFIFGPQFSIFPDERLNIIKSTNSVYNLLSDWVINIWSSFEYCNNLKLIKLPFGVDTEKFNYIKPIQERTKVFVYFKRRNPSELNYLLIFLQRKNIEIKVFNYISGYSEEVYLDYLQNSKYGIWLDAHESQGFALQEALSCDVPLLVWNVSSMNQEQNSSYNNIPATTIPYWNKSCGEYFYNEEELENTYNLFISKLDTYKPREFILENLSVETCENKLINFIENM